MANHFQAYLKMCKELATLGTCPRAQIGVMAIKENRVLLTGYNGAPSKEPQCNQVGCLVDDGDHCIRAVHAEQNLVGLAARWGISLDGSSMIAYSIVPNPSSLARIVKEPTCERCTLLVKTAGIVEAVCKVEGIDEVFKTIYVDRTFRTEL